MKKYLLLFVTMISFGVATAQLKVESSGNVVLNNNVAIGSPIDTCVKLNIYRESVNNYPIYGVKTHILTNTAITTGSMYGVYSYADASATTAQPSSLTRIIGVTGLAMCSSSAGNRFVAGVVGVANSIRGVGVYGAISSSTSYALPTSWNPSSYAGYFAGNTRVTGTLMAATVTQTSDYRLKTDIQDLSSVSYRKIMNLRPVSYKFNPADTINYVYPSDAKEMQVRHYGLIAQEVQNVLPDLVYENGDGILSINYIELIPLLIQAINTQQQQITDLQAQIAAQSPVGSSQKNKAPKESTSNSLIEQAVLYQNNPNPFTQDTRINYLLPQNTENATLFIYNMNGSQIAEYPISSFGEGHVIVSANALDAGMYLYSLVADGQVIDTKRMILTK